MSDEREPPGSTGNPLAGVLDRLLDRERGRPTAQPVAESDAIPRPEVVVPPETAPPFERRMLAIAGPGTGLGDAAVQSAAQWAALIGRSPSVTDLCCGESRVRATSAESELAAEGKAVPLARVPCELDRVRREPAEIVLALLDRLRRHEFASDLSLVRIPIRQRRTLMRAAFLSGALVVPVEESEREFGEAVGVACEVAENFHDISIWPFARSPRYLERFLDAVPRDLGARTVPFDPGHLDLKSNLEGLTEPPREGFLVGLLAPEPAALPPELLQVDTLRF